MKIEKLMEEEILHMSESRNSADEMDSMSGGGQEGSPGNAEQHSDEVEENQDDLI